MSMREQEKSFITELARCMIAICGQNGLAEKHLPYPYHDFAYQYFQLYLWRLNLAKRDHYEFDGRASTLIGSLYLPEYEAQFPDKFKSELNNLNSIGETRNIDEVDAYISFAHIETEQDYLYDLLPRLLSYLTHHGLSEKLPTPFRKTFVVQDADLRALMEAMVVENYATKINGQYQWTDKIARAMVCAHIWGEEEIKADSKSSVTPNAITSLLEASHNIPSFLSDYFTTTTSLGLAVASTLR